MPAPDPFILCIPACVGVILLGCCCGCGNRLPGVGLMFHPRNYIFPYPLVLPPERQIIPEPLQKQYILIKNPHQQDLCLGISCESK